MHKIQSSIYFEITLFFCYRFHSFSQFIFLLRFYVYRAFCQFNLICSSSNYIFVNNDLTIIMRLNFNVLFFIVQSNLIIQYVASQWGINTCNCGGVQTMGDMSPKVVNGQLVRGDRMPYPWLVRIIHKKNIGLCGGVILNRRFIASAAHCTNDVTGKSPTPIGKPKDFHILIFPNRTRFKIIIKLRLCEY